MGLDLLPYLEDHTCLVAHNTHILKLKVLYRDKLTAGAKSEYLKHVSREDAHDQLEQVLRALLYMLERDHQIAAIQSKDFVVYSSTAPWVVANRIDFQVDGKAMQCYPKYLIMNVECKNIPSHVDDTNPVMSNDFQAPLSNQKRTRLSAQSKAVISSNNIDRNNGPISTILRTPCVGTTNKQQKASFSPVKRPTLFNILHRQDNKSNNFSHSGVNLTTTFERVNGFSSVSRQRRVFLDLDDDEPRHNETNLPPSRPNQANVDHPASKACTTEQKSPEMLFKSSTNVKGSPHRLRSRRNNAQSPQENKKSPLRKEPKRNDASKNQQRQTSQGTVISQDAEDDNNVTETALAAIKRHRHQIAQSRVENCTVDNDINSANKNGGVSFEQNTAASKKATSCLTMQDTSTVEVCADGSIVCQNPKRKRRNQAQEVEDRSLHLEVLEDNLITGKVKEQNRANNTRTSPRKTACSPKKKLYTNIGDSSDFVSFDRLQDEKYTESSREINRRTEMSHRGKLADDFGDVGSTLPQEEIVSNYRNLLSYNAHNRNVGGDKSLKGIYNSNCSSKGNQKQIMSPRLGKNQNLLVSPSSGENQNLVMSPRLGKKQNLVVSPRSGKNANPFSKMSKVAESTESEISESSESSDTSSDSTDTSNDTADETAKTAHDRRQRVLRKRNITEKKNKAQLDSSMDTLSKGSPKNVKRLKTDKRKQISSTKTIQEPLSPAARSHLKQSAYQKSGINKTQSQSPTSSQTLSDSDHMPRRSPRKGKVYSSSVPVTPVRGNRRRVNIPHSTSRRQALVLAKSRLLEAQDGVWLLGSSSKKKKQRSSAQARQIQTRKGRKGQQTKEEYKVTPQWSTGDRLATKASASSPALTSSHLTPQNRSTRSSNAGDRSRSSSTRPSRFWQVLASMFGSGRTDV